VKSNAAAAAFNQTHLEQESDSDSEVYIQQFALVSKWNYEHSTTRPCHMPLSLSLCRFRPLSTPPRPLPHLLQLQHCLTQSIALMTFEWRTVHSGQHGYWDNSCSKDEQSTNLLVSQSLILSHSQSLNWPISAATNVG